MVAKRQKKKFELRSCQHAVVPKHEKSGGRRRLVVTPTKRRCGGEEISTKKRSRKFPVIEVHQ